MVTVSGSGFKSRKERRKQMELEEARKAGLVPAQVDEDGNEINPHIPRYMSSSPWYANNADWYANNADEQKPTLKHQRKRKLGSASIYLCCDRGAKLSQAEKYEKGACENCGARSHKAKYCVDRPRKVGAKYNSKHIAPDEKIENIELDYAGKRDPWNGYDASNYALVVQRYEARDAARRAYLEEQQLGKLVENDEDETRVDDGGQMDFAKFQKRVRTAGGGSTGTARNLRIREDRAKYLLNLDVNSAYYDPKTRSMREDPFPDADPNEKFYGGDNQSRNTGQALEFKQVNSHSCMAFDKGQHIHMQAAPSQAEATYKNNMAVKVKSMTRTKDAIVEKYGNAASEDEFPKEVLLGQSEIQVEYDRAGLIIQVQDTVVTRSKYEDDVFINNHTSVWGSWWDDGQWGYKCCRQMIRNSYCKGVSGIRAAGATTDLKKANINRK